MKILYVGGGSGGPVSPLLAIHEQFTQQGVPVDALFIGTKTGPERSMVQHLGIPFRAISSGKLRRYLSMQNLVDPFRIIRGFFQARSILKNFRPDVVLTAGSFVSVPAYFAARMLRIPVFVHQQDIIVGLANKIMARGATAVTVTFKESLEDFDSSKAYCTGNPVRVRFAQASEERGRAFTGLAPAFPTILILGGGQGAAAINQLVLESVGTLVQQFQIVHITGPGKSIEDKFVDYYNSTTRRLISERYKSFPFIQQELSDVIASADVVVTRAGISFLSELAYLKKPTIIIPIPDSHQEANARYIAKYNAGVVLDQKTVTTDEFITVLTTLLTNDADKANLSRNIGQLIDSRAGERYVQLIKDVISQS